MAIAQTIFLGLLRFSRSSSYMSLSYWEERGEKGRRLNCGEEKKLKMQKITARPF